MVNQFEIGRRVKTFRTEKGYTQVEFAKIVGTSRSMVGRIERGEANLEKVDTHVITKFAKTLGVTTEQFLGLEPVHEITEHECQCNECTCGKEEKKEVITDGISFEPGANPADHICVYKPTLYERIVSFIKKLFGI